MFFFLKVYLYKVYLYIIIVNEYKYHLNNKERMVVTMKKLNNWVVGINGQKDVEVIERAYNSVIED